MCADADPSGAAARIIASKTFDHGIVCGSEHNLVVDANVYPTFVGALEARGSAVLSPHEVSCFASRAFDANGYLHPDLLGKAASYIAAHVGIERPTPVRLIVVPACANAVDGVLAAEKLAPVLSLFRVEGAEQGIAVCQALLARHGRGHTAIIHSFNQALIERFGIEMPASRILVNAPGSQGCIGLGTGLVPSFTLGCGTLGASSTTDNVTYTHLLNIKRMAVARSVVWAA